MAPNHVQHKMVFKPWAKKIAKVKKAIEANSGLEMSRAGGKDFDVAEEIAEQKAIKRA